MTAKHAGLVIIAGLVAIGALVWYFLFRIQAEKITAAPLSASTIAPTLVSLSSAITGTSVIGEQVVPAPASHNQEIIDAAGTALVTYNQQQADVDLYNQTLAVLVAKQQAEADAATATARAAAAAAETIRIAAVTRAQYCANPPMQQGGEPWAEYVTRYRAWQADCAEVPV